VKRFHSKFILFLFNFFKKDKIVKNRSEYLFLSKAMVNLSKFVKMKNSFFYYNSFYYFYTEADRTL